MSIEMNIQSPNKKELADLLIAIANLIKASGNQTVTVTVTGEILFNKCDKE